MFWKWNFICSWKFSPNIAWTKANLVQVAWELFYYKFITSRPWAHFPFCDWTQLRVTLFPSQRLLLSSSRFEYPLTSNLAETSQFFYPLFLHETSHPDPEHDFLVKSTVWYLLKNQLFCDQNPLWSQTRFLSDWLNWSKLLNDHCPAASNTSRPNFQTLLFKALLVSTPPNQLNDLLLLTWMPLSKATVNDWGKTLVYTDLWLLR